MRALQLRAADGETADVRSFSIDALHFAVAFDADADWCVALPAGAVEEGRWYLDP